MRGKDVFVANSNDNTVSRIDARSSRTVGDATQNRLRIRRPSRERLRGVAVAASARSDPRFAGAGATQDMTFVWSRAIQANGRKRAESAHPIL